MNTVLLPVCFGEISLVHLPVVEFPVKQGDSKRDVGR